MTGCSLSALPGLLTQPRPQIVARPKQATQLPRKPKPYSLHAVQPHALRDERGRLRCSTCLRSASLTSGSAAVRAFAASMCRGKVSNQVGVGHDLFVSGGVLWCKRCGSYTSGQHMQLLRGDCNGPSPDGCASVRRLAAGRHPVSNTWLGPPQRHLSTTGARGGLLFSSAEPSPLDAGVQPQSAHSWQRDGCAADLSQAWSRRVISAPEAEADECSSCRAQTKLRCTSCATALCLQCARTKLTCAGATAGRGGSSFRATSSGDGAGIGDFDNLEI